MEEIEMSEYWEEKVKKVVKISEEYGFLYFNVEFWREKPAGILSLIVDIYNSKEKEHK